MVSDTTDQEPERRALADTSIFIGLEHKRIPEDSFLIDASVSVVTIAELHLGVLSAQTVEARAQRMRTLRFAESLVPLPIDDDVAEAWAILRARLRAAGKKVLTNDSWIAATAIARKMPIATQDRDYHDLPGLRVIRV